MNIRLNALYCILLLSIVVDLSGVVKHQNLPACLKCHEMLEICSPLLKDWFAEEQELDPTVHIMESYRNEKKQNAALKSGSSRVGWGESAHNYLPCLAIDLCFIIDGKSKQISSKYRAMAKRLPKTLENGNIFTRLVDWCHFQVKDWQLVAHDYPRGNILK